MSLLQQMLHRVRIDRLAYARDVDDMGELRTSSTISTDVHAWVQNASRSEILEYQKRDQEITDRVFFNLRPDLQVGDTVTVLSGPSRVGQVFKVKAWEERSAGKGVLWGAMCEVER